MLGDKPDITRTSRKRRALPTPEVKSGRFAVMHKTCQRTYVGIALGPMMSLNDNEWGATRCSDGLGKTKLGKYPLKKICGYPRLCRTITSTPTSRPGRVVASC